MELIKLKSQKLNNSILRVFGTLMLCILFFVNTYSQNQLELANGSYLSAPNGLSIVNQTAVLLENTAGSVFNSYVPNISVTASLSNQQFNTIPNAIISTTKGMSFGGRVNNYANNATQVPVFNYMNTIDSPTNISYTSNPNGPTFTGIDVAANSAFYIYNSTYPLYSSNAALNGRYYYGDLTFTFSSPVSNPVLQIVGLGANINFGGGNIQGFSSELELQTNGINLSKLSGNNELNVANNTILNNAANPSFICGSGAACGSVKVIGTNITTIVFKIFLRGDGNGSSWSHANINTGDELMIGVSINKPVSLIGNIFKDINGLTDNTVNGNGTNINNSLYVNLIDANNIVVATSVVSANGTYTFEAISAGNYSLLVSTMQGIQGNIAPLPILPANWVFTGENIGLSLGNDGLANGIIAVSVDSAGINNINFGINTCPTFFNASSNQLVCVGNTGANITLQTNFNDANSIRFVKFTSNQIAGQVPTNNELAAIYAGTTLSVNTPNGSAAPYTATLAWNNSSFPNTTSMPITYYVYAITNPDMGLPCRPIQAYTVTVNPCVVSLTENGTIPATGGTAIVNIVSNDSISGSPATLGTGGNATVSQVGSWPSGITLNPTTGAITIVAGTTPGTYPISYQLCNKLSPANCSTVEDTIFVTPIINPITETGTVTALGGTAIANVANNDFVNGIAATLGTTGNATVSQVGSWPNGITLNTTTGSIEVVAGKPSGNYLVIYNLCDKLSPPNCKTITDTIKVYNSVPIAFADTISTLEDNAITGNIANNDTLSVDGGNVWSLFVSPTHGTVVVNANGTYTYTPTANYNGIDSFVYKLCDIDNDCDTAIVKINVISVNDLPTANSDIITTTENNAIDIMVTANDDFGGDGPSVGSIAITLNAHHGQAAVANNGTPNDPTDDFITYIPNTNYDGLDTIIYQICDANNDCDTAIIYLNIIKCKTISTTNISICPTALPYVWNTNTYTSSGTYLVHLVNANSCDSAATLVLNILPTSTSTTNISICPTALPYSWNGLTFTVGGTQTAHLTNSVGCDSAATLVLNILPTSTSTTNISICPTALPYTWNGLTFTGASTQTAHLTNSLGCDSAATLNLFINSPTASSTNITVCSNSLPYTWNGNTFNATGTYLVHLTNAAGCDSAATLVLNTTPKPAVTVSENVVCGGGNVLLSATNATTGTWSQVGTNAIGANLGATNAGVANVVFAGNANSTYRFVYAINNGCTDTLDVFAGNPTASFSYVKKCNGNVEFINTSINANDYEWVFGNGGYCTPSKANVTHSFLSNNANGTTYTISLIAKNNGVCADTISQIITIYPNALTVFSTTMNGCSRKVNFNNFSANSFDYKWDFGVTSLTTDTSSQKNTSYTYATDGTYNVKLISSNNEGCGDTLVKTITVNATGVSPTANFTINNVSSACANRYQFTNTSTNAVSYQWIFEDSTTAYTTNTSKSFATAGTYSVKLVAMSSTGCFDTITKTINVLTNSTGAVAAFKVNRRTSCLANNSFEFVNTSSYLGGGWIPTHEWNFGDGTTNNINTSVYGKRYANIGIYTIQLIETGSDGCKDTAYQSIEILPSPIASFTANTACGMTAKINNQTTGAIANIWNFGNGAFMQNNDTAFTYKYKTEDWYFVTLTAIGANGCIDSIDRGVLPTKAGAPVPFFTFDTVTCSGAIRFKNLTTGGAETLWDFGDGSPLSSEYHPSKAYAVRGTYTVTLNVSNGPFCSASYSSFVGAPEGQNINLPKAIMNHNVEACTNKITADDISNNANARSWYFDNVLISNLPNVLIQNPTIGGHELKLVVSNGDCYDTYKQLIIIQSTPVSKFTHQISTCSRTVLFNSQTSVGHTYNWKFNDPGAVSDTSSGAFVSHTFSTNGTYIVSLKTTNLSGCNHTIYDTITVAASGSPLNASFKFENTTCNCVCNNKIKFTNTTTGNANSYLWNFGDGNSSILKNPNKGYANSGYYTATLTVSDTVGCFSIASAQVFVPEGSKGPSASFNTDNPVQCLTGNNYSFYNTSSYMGAGWNNKYYWYFGDGTFDTTNTFVFNKKYTKVGIYTVTLVAVGSDNCRDTMTLAIQVKLNNCMSFATPIEVFNPQNNGILNAIVDSSSTGINEKLIDKNTTWTLYPNPNTGKFKIVCSQLLNKVKIDIVDILGRKVNATINQNNADNTFEIHSANIKSGNYFVIITDEKNGTKTYLKFNITE